MSYSIEKLLNEAIIIAHANALYADGEDVSSFTRELSSTLDQQKTPVYLVVDITGLDLTLDQLIEATAFATRDTQIFKHPKVIETLSVSDSPYLNLASQGLNNPAFGNVEVRIFAQIELALAYARGRFAAN